MINYKNYNATTVNIDQKGNSTISHDAVKAEMYLERPELKLTKWDKITYWIGKQWIRFKALINWGKLINKG